jgi:DUF2934 family protein
MKTNSNAPGGTRRITIDPPDVPKSGLRAWATEDHEVIRRWAERHQAEPATGEATRSGPATASVNDGGAGVRFNFPGFARYRPIDWDEWFDNFDRNGLTFVYEDDVEVRAHELFESRGREHGHDREDWLEAEHQLGKPATGLSARYRLIKGGTQGT